MTSEKRVDYLTSSSYTTLNDPDGQVKNLWMVFHGMGYLSRYFLKYFKELEPQENYIVAPQAPSKYYLTDAYKHVGASWLTREDTLQETNNVLAYLDKVWEAESSKDFEKLIVLGYSQGVSIATRWLSSRKIQCDHLILHSGGIPVELRPEDFLYMKDQSKVTYLYGDKDQYINEARKTEEQLKANRLFGDKISYHVFDGIHEVSKEFIQQISKGADQ